MKNASQKQNQTIGYFITFIILGLATASLGPALPYLAEQTGSKLNQISILFATKAVGYLFGSVVGGRLYDRLAGHKVIAVGLAGIIFSLMLIPLMPLLWLLGSILFLLGFMEGAVDVGGNTLLVWVHRGQVGPYMNALHLFFGVGTFFAPIILAQSLLRSESINLGFWLMAFLILPLMVWMLRLPSPVAPAHEQDKEGLSNTWLLALIVLFFFLYVGAEMGFGGWVYTYAFELGLADETTAAYLTSTFWGAFTLGRVFSIPIAARLRPRWILTGDLVGCLASLGLILLLPDAPIALWVGTIMLGLSMASIFPTMISFAERRMTLSGAMTSWFFVGASLGGMVLPWVVGQVFEPLGPQIAMLLFFIALVLNLIVFLALMAYSKNLAPQTE